MNNDYKIMYIKTKKKVRKLVTYNNLEQKELHNYINKKLLSTYKPSIFAKGYIKGESIYSNVTAHMYNNYFFKTDIKNFFPSINHNRLVSELHKEIKSVATIKDCRDIVDKCSYSDRGLPLGFVTSPILSNIYLKRFDIELYHKLKYLDCDSIIYTRYADDIMISFKKTEIDLLDLKNQIYTIVEECLRSYNLKVNNRKTKFIDFKKNKQVRLTGVTIVEKQGKRKISIGRNHKRKFFYDVINIANIKKEKRSSYDVSRLKGLLSFYLSIEKTEFEKFISNNMKKELHKHKCKTLCEMVKKL